MVRLPVPGQDDGHWGDLLNDFLLVGHNRDGTLRGVQTAYNLRDYGARGDGQSDDSAAFSSALDQIPASGGLLYLPAGTYRISSILLNNRRDVSMMGCGTGTVIAPDTGGQGLAYVGCIRCHLGNLRIDGSLHGGATGLSIAGNFDAKLFNLHINDMSEDGILINGDNPVGSEIELYNVTCRNNGGFGYHYTRTTTTDTGGIYLTNFRTLYNTRGAGGIKIESAHVDATPVFHMLNNTVTDNYSAPAVVLHNVAHCRFSGLWAGVSRATSTILVDGGGHMIEIDGAYIVNGNPQGYNISLNGEVNGIFLDKLDLDGTPLAHIHVGSSGANFFLGQYQSFGSSPLTDTLDGLYRRSSFVMQHSPVTFATDSAGSYSTSIGLEDIRHPGRQKWLRNANGTLQILDTAFRRPLLELQDNGLLRWNNGSWLSKHLSGLASWEPGTIPSHAYVATTLPVPGASIGDTVASGFSLPLPSGMLISGAVTAAGTVTVTLYNATDTPQHLSQGSLRADVWQHQGES